MGDEKTTGVMPSSFLSRFDRGGSRFWVVTAAACIIIPPIGLILALYMSSYSKNNNPRAKYLVMALVTLCLSIAGALAYLKVYSASVTSQKKYERYTQTGYEYSKFDSYKLSSKSGKFGIEFKKPVELQINEGATIRDGYTEMNHRIRRGDYNTSFLASETVPVTPAPSEIYLSKLNSQLIYDKDAGHKVAKAPITKFVISQFSDEYDITMGAPKAFKTSNIKANAWETDFLSKHKSVPVVFKGKIFLLVGKSTYYYFLIMSQDTTWTSNTNNWDTVENSIKIDQ